MFMRLILLGITLFFAVAANGQLLVAVSSPRVTGNTVVISLAMKNGLPEIVESARAAVFLLDDQGKMLNQATRWVIGGDALKTGLPAGGTNTFNFVMTSAKPITSTNLTAKVTFSRIVLEGGKLADPIKSVKIEH
jgi:hypothetical protein